jgi:hypothetical protein
MSCRAPAFSSVKDARIEAVVRTADDEVRDDDHIQRAQARSSPNENRVFWPPESV